MINGTIPTILTLLSTVSFHQEVKLINQLNNFFDFDHNILLLDSSIDYNRYVHGSDSIKDNYTPQSLYNFEWINNSIVGLESLKKIRSKNTFLIVVPASSQSEGNIKLFARIKSIQRLNIYMKIGVFFPDLASTHSIEKMFRLCWDEHRMLNVFAAFYQTTSTKSVLNFFTFNPFGAFNVINVTKSKTLKDYVDKLPNLQKHPLRVPLVGVNIADYDAKLWGSVRDILNASISRVRINGTMMALMQTPLKLLDADVIDIVPYLHLSEEHRNVYPMVMDKLVIIVPQALPFSGFMAYLQRITSDHLFIYFFLTIVVVSLLLTLSRFLKEKKILFLKSVLDVSSLIMNDNSTVKYTRLHRADVCLIVPLTFAGLVFVNGILSIFQSYVTLPVIQPQIDTTDDLYKSPFPILVPNTNYAIEVTDLLGNISKHDGWSSKVCPVILDEINEQILNFNTSISYATMYSRAKMLLEIQKRFNIRGYHIPNEFCLKESMLTYSVNDNFPFIERLNDIIHSLREGGIYQKWLEENEELMVKIFVRNRKVQAENVYSSNVEEFPTVICYGWAASIIVFIIELIWQWYKFYNLRKPTSPLVFN